MLGLRGKRLTEAAARTIADLGLTGLEGRVTGTFSGGRLRRVGLAVALLGSPDVLVLDEPTVGLDPVLRRDLWQMFHRLADMGATLLVSVTSWTRQPRCDHLLFMRQGRFLAEATPAPDPGEPVRADTSEERCLRLATRRDEAPFTGR